MPGDFVPAVAVYGFQFTGLFLPRHVLEPRGQGHSGVADGLINAVIKARALALDVVALFP